jgi:putative membrane protein
MKDNIYNWLLNILVYGLVLVITSLVFKNYFYLDLSDYGIWVIIVSILVYLLNRTIKPLLTWLTLPLTAVTLGLFIFVINVMILKIADLLVGPHFEITNLFMAILAAVFISILHSMMESIIVKPLKK